MQPVVATRAARLAGTPARGYKPRMWLLGWLAGCEGGAGRIDQREPVQVLGSDGRELGRGLCSFSSEELLQIIGLSSEEVRRRFGDVGDAVVHRDAFVLTAVD